VRIATLFSIFALALMGCVLDNPATPDARAFAELDGSHVPGFRDAGCPGSGPSGTPSGTRSSGTSGLGCDDAAPPEPSIDAAPPCGEHSFRYSGTATESVWVTGSFTDWAATPPGALPLSNDGLGVWTLTTDVGPGRHLYKLIIDGDTWITDPSNDLLEDDGDGNVNSVLELCTSD